MAKKKIVEESQVDAPELEGEEEEETEEEDEDEESEEEDVVKPKGKRKVAKKKTAAKKAPAKKTAKKKAPTKKATKKKATKAKRAAARKEVNRVRDLIIESIRKAGATGLHSYDLAKITGQTSEKLARQALRKARWDMAEAGYRLCAEKERDEGRYKIYRAVKVDGGSVAPIEKKLEVVFYPLKTA